MKIKTLCVAPYAAMVNLIEECGEKDSELDLEIKVGNLQEGVALAKDAEAQGFEVIISRGGTAKLIGEAVNLPVIDVPVSGYDMLRVLTLANDLPRKKAIVGFPSITLGAKAMIDLLDIPIDIFTIESEDETEALLKSLKQAGYQLIMGDVVTFDVASRLELQGVLIQSGREAILDAFKEAKRVSRWMMKNRQEIERLKTILQVIAADFMVFSAQGDVIYEQWKNFNARPVTDMPFEAAAFQDNSGSREITHLMDSNGESFKLTKTKIIIHETAYLVCEFTRFHRNQAAQENLKGSMPPPPIVIHQSKAMNTCLTMIDRCLTYNHFILTGPSGSEMELLARYIHYHKFHANGLYAWVKAADLPVLSPEKVDNDIKTIYIDGFPQLDEVTSDECWMKMEALKENGVTVILPVIEEPSLWGNRIYEDGIIRIHIPSLAERKEDLKELVASLILHFNQTLGTSAVKINEKALVLLADYQWPGDVGELSALLKEAVLMEKGYVIEQQLIASLLNQKGTAGIHGDLLTGSLENIEKKIIEKVLEEEGYNQTKAAKRLDINRSTLWRKLKG